MIKETRDKISNLQTINSHKTQRIAELTAMLDPLLKLRQAVSLYLDAMLVNEPTEKHLEVMRYFLRLSERPSGQAFKR